MKDKNYNAQEKWKLQLSVNIQILRATYNLPHQVKYLAPVVSFNYFSLDIFGNLKRLKGNYITSSR